MTDVIIRPAMPADLPDLRLAMVELQEHERRLDATTRLPGEQIADAYLARLRQEVAAKRGAIFIAERNGVFAGFAVGWIIERDHIPESADSNRFGYLSDICVMPAYRRERIARSDYLRRLNSISRASVLPAFACSLRQRMRQLARPTRAPAFRPTRYFMKRSWTGGKRPAHEQTRPDQLARTAGARGRGRRARLNALSRILHSQHPQPAHTPSVWSRG